MMGIKMLINAKLDSANEWSCPTGVVIEAFTRVNYNVLLKYGSLYDHMQNRWYDVNHNHHHNVSVLVYTFGLQSEPIYDQELLNSSLVEVASPFETVEDPKPSNITTLLWQAVKEELPIRIWS